MLRILESNLIFYLVIIFTLGFIQLATQSIIADRIHASEVTLEILTDIIEVQADILTLIDLSPKCSI